MPRGAFVVAGLLTVALAAAGGGYGFHRDELYLIEAGQHPAWGYPDQPAVAPLLAAGLHRIVGGSLWGFRLLPAVLAGLLVLVAAATSAQLGGTRRDRVITATVTALSTTVLVVGHLFSTTTFDILLTATTVWLLLRALDSPPEHSVRRWLLVGLSAGLALQFKALIASVLLACAVALLLAGPRAPLRGRGPWLAAALAAAMAVPNLLWQAANGWPQLELSRAIAAGSSGTSVERWLILPLQFTLTGPVIAAVLVAGVDALLRDRDLRTRRWIGVAYLLLLALFIATGGKPYYTAGLLPTLLAAGVPAMSQWVDGSAARRRLAVLLLVVHAAISAVIALPVVPVTALHATPLLDVNYDAGETVGWDRFVATLAGVARTVPQADRPSTIVLTGNYGEAGALDRARRAGADLPPVYSGHNGYGLWGPPPGTATTTVLVGWFDDAQVARLFSECRTVARIDNGIGLDNEEQGAPVRVCGAPVRPWSQTWPQIVHLG
jgi:4-amino-4-deoxy-L-arabinose transferase-like glycosyltransferase